MSEVGSDAWLERYASAVATMAPGDARISVRHRIDGGPTWVLRVDERGVTVDRADDSTAADVTFTWQRADAEAVARGQASPLDAFQAGRLRVGGDLHRLAEVAGLFAAFPAVTVDA